MLKSDGYCHYACLPATNSYTFSTVLSEPRDVDMFRPSENTPKALLSVVLDPSLNILKSLAISFPVIVVLLKSTYFVKNHLDSDPVFASHKYGHSKHTHENIIINK